MLVLKVVEVVVVVVSLESALAVAQTGARDSVPPRPVLTSQFLEVASPEADLPPKDFWAPLFLGVELEKLP